MRAARALPLLAALLGLVLAVAASGCGSHAHATGARNASPLGIVSAATPRFPVAHFLTQGTFPQARDPKLALGSVNDALRSAIVADQRTFAAYARRYVKRAAGRRPRGHLGFYETELDRPLFAASTVVLSALLPRSRSVLGAPLRSGDLSGWLGITIRVPSGARVRLPDLFAERAEAMRVIEGRIRADKLLAPSVRRDPAAALANPQFALLPSGLAIGVVEIGWQDDVIVPYSALRPYLSRLGLELVAGVRWADFRPDRHRTYCRRPDNSGAELSATGDVPCATASRVEFEVFSARCGSKTRCRAVGFTCLAVWSGLHGEPFTVTHHAICKDGKRRIVMDEG
jgi:hypothetical protein